jgi:RimJ/RimL family protein N-acetyltransferase
MCDRRLRVGLAQTNAFAGLPEGNGRGKVVEAKVSQVHWTGSYHSGYAHTILVGRAAGAVRASLGYFFEVSRIFETQRLFLREMTEADAGHLLALSRNPNVMRYIRGEAPLTTQEAALAVLRERIFPQYALGLGRWACIDKRSGEYLGWCGIKHMPAVREYDLGYRFFEHHWGKGYATEAASAAGDFARERLRGERVVGKALRDNVASRRVLEKIGMVFEGDVEEEGCAVAVYVLIEP